MIIDDGLTTTLHRACEDALTKTPRWSPVRVSLKMTAPAE
jgi:hypothetical protein